MKVSFLAVFFVATAAAVINVHVSPHTHDDVGWDETYMQCASRVPTRTRRTPRTPLLTRRPRTNAPFADYQGDGPIGGRNVTRILQAVVAGLLQDPSRRFSYVEQA